MAEAHPIAQLRIHAARRVLAVLDTAIAAKREAFEAGAASPAEVLALLRCHADLTLIAGLPCERSELWLTAHHRHLDKTMTTPEDGLEVTCV